LSYATGGSFFEMSPDNFPVATAILLPPGGEEWLLQHLFVKLFKGLSPGRAAGGFLRLRNSDRRLHDFLRGHYS